MGSIPFIGGGGVKSLAGYGFMPEVFLRTPFYGFRGYDPARLPEVLADLHFRNAVWLASPVFYGLLEKKGFQWEALDDKTRHTLLKYYNRMSFRPTPFGSFSAFSLLRWGASETVRLKDHAGTVLHLLPDQGAVIAGLPFGVPAGEELIRLNPMLYRAGAQFRYIRSAPDENGKYRFSLDALEASGFHAKLFRLLERKDLSFDALTKKVMALASCTAPEASDYLGFLLDEQALFREGSGSVIAGDGDKIYRPPYGSLPLAETGCLADRAKGLPTGRVKEKSPYYAVLERSVVAGGGPDMLVQAELRDALGALRLLSPVRQPGALGSFIKMFSERYDRQAVPLLEALDPDSGIGYDGLAVSKGLEPALEGIALEAVQQGAAPVSWSPVHSLLLRRWLQDTSRSAFAPVVLSSEDLEGLPENEAEPALPPTFPVMFRQTADHLLIESAGGVSANTLAGRFSLVSEEVLAFCRGAAEGELAAYPDAVLADIALLTDLHVDNINRRRSIYPYEITLNTLSSLRADRQIRPSELLLSVQDGDLVLWCPRLEKRVVPRLASAYNYRHTDLAVFRLLCDMQHQGLQASLAFDPEEFFPGLDFYPQFRYGQVVISPARWVLNKASVEELLGGGDAERLAALRKLREAKGLPRMVAMGVADQQLVFDLSDRNGVLFLLRCLAGKVSATLTEYLEPDLNVRAGGKPMAGQYIAFLASDRDELPPAGQVSTNRRPAGLRPVYPARHFSPGSEWLYLKVYCSPAMADRLLAEFVCQFLKIHRQVIQSWFFIRYHDPAHHLRLRFRSDKAGYLLEAFAAGIAPFIHRKIAREFMADTYRRELERYGLDLIAEVEEVFRAGSEVVLADFKAAAEADRYAQLRSGLLAACHMLAVFLPDLSSQLKFVTEMAHSFQREFAAGKQTRLAIDGRYRELKNEVDLALSPGPMGLLADFMDGLAKLAARVEERQRRQLAADLIHMQMNRNFPSRQRHHEYLVYEFLKKHLAGRLAREKR